MNRSVTGEMDMPLNTKSRSESRSGGESTEEKEDTDVSLHHSLIQSPPRFLSSSYSHLLQKKRELKSAQGTGLGIGDNLNSLIHASEQCSMYNPARNRTSRAELTTWPKNDDPQEYEMKGKRRKKTNKAGLLEDSDLLPYGKNKQSEKEKTESLLSEPMFYQECSLKKNEQKESEMTNWFSDTAWKLPMASFESGLVYNPIGMTASTKAMEEETFDHHVKQSGPRRMLQGGRTLMRSSLIPCVKHRQTQTEITGSFLSNTPGDGLKVDHIGRVPKSGHSKYPPSCSLSMTSFVNESTAGSSTANPESKEIVTHSIMKSETMPDDCKLRGTSGSSGLSSRSCLLPCSHSMVSLSKIPRAKNNFTQVNSSPDMLLNEFTPVITDDFDDENYTFQCSCPGLYQCSVTGLVFLMMGEGDVVYRTVPWNRRLLTRHHKKPAGPLFDIKCQQQSVCQLCLPHCELISTGGGQFLKVAHVKDEGIEFITPHRITETHVVINITGFSGYGNVKDEDSPCDPVQALVLLFYKPPVCRRADPDLRSFLSVLLLPRNIVIRDVQRTRRKLIGDERYIDTPPHCKLHPKQVYTLSTVPVDDLNKKVQPQEMEFDDEYHDSYFTSFQVILRIVFTDISLSLKEKSSSTCVWERDLCLFSPTVETMNICPSQRLANTRSCFTEGISRANLSSMIDKLLEKKVITDAEREAADAMQGKREKARFLIDTVRSKGDAASSEFINFLRELDRIFFEHLGLN